MKIQARMRAFHCRKLIAEQKTAAAKAMRIFFLLGGPGSGKSTYAKRLAAEFGVLHVSVGQLLVRPQAICRCDQR
jgi:MoxR-like ATPase